MSRASRFVCLASLVLPVAPLVPHRGRIPITPATPAPGPDATPPATHKHYAVDPRALQPGPERPARAAPPEPRLARRSR